MLQRYPVTFNCLSATFTLNWDFITVFSHFTGVINNYRNFSSRMGALFREGANFYKNTAIWYVRSVYLLI